MNEQLVFLVVFACLCKSLCSWTAKAQSQVQASGRGIFSALAVVVVFSSFLGVAGNFDEPLIKLLAGALVMSMTVLIWTLIPAVVLGGALGCCLYRDSKMEKS